MSAFAYAHGADWRECGQVRRGSAGRAGAWASSTSPTRWSTNPRRFSASCASATGVADWIGTCRHSACSRPAPSTRTSRRSPRWWPTSMPSAVFSGRAPLKEVGAASRVVHADPGAPDVPGLVADMSAKVASGYLVGGLSSSRSRTVQIANAVLSGGLSGAALGAAGRRGHAPHAGLRRRIPAAFASPSARRTSSIALDGRPALDVLQEAIGERARSASWSALPVPGSDTGDYTARNLVGVDPRRQADRHRRRGRAGHRDPVLQARRGRGARRPAAHPGGAESRRSPQPRGALYYLLPRARRAHVRPPRCGTRRSSGARSARCRW